MATIASPRSNSPAITNITSPPSPSSSVRPSVDLPAGQVPANNAASNQRRNRAALRDYYNLKAKATPDINSVHGASPAPSVHNLSRSGSITSTTSESTNISSATVTTDAGNRVALPGALDSPTFDADAYIATLLKTCTLKEILQLEGTLVSEIRNLDGERKALVYDNYSKLIVAVGTIAEMQRGIVEERGKNGEVSGLARMRELEGKLDSLMNGFREVMGHKDRTSQDETTRATRAEQRQAVRSERKKRELVTWVLTSPDRLRVMMENNEREKAEKEWKQIQILLKKWEGTKGVAEVYANCQRLMPQDDAGND